jgi:hypothetical protein
VIDRQHTRQSHKPSAIRPLPFPFLLRTRLNIWTVRHSDAPFHLPYLLPSSVSCNSFVCHSYENCRGVYQQFPFWNEFTPPSPTLSGEQSRGATHYLPLIQVLSFQLLAHSFAFFCTQQKLNSFAFMRFHTLCQKHRGWVGGRYAE